MNFIFQVIKIVYAENENMLLRIININKLEFFLLKMASEDDECPRFSVQEFYSTIFEPVIVFLIFQSVIVRRSLAILVLYTFSFV
jgi:hypothetical protein